jgi:hypothetical protein
MFAQYANGSRELFDEDPDELHNLTRNAAYRNKLRSLRPGHRHVPAGAARLQLVAADQTSDPLRLRDATSVESGYLVGSTQE